MRTPLPHFSNRQSGMTLVELMVVVAVLGILAAVGIPSFTSMMENRRIIGAGDNLLADMRFAQTESSKRNLPVHLVITTGAQWSYNVCLTPDCTGGQDPVRRSAGSDYRGTALAAEEALLTFDPKRGTLTQAPAATTTMMALTLGSRQVGLQVDPLSQFRLCSSAGTGGYPACPSN